jgi:hypothetical protein
MTKKVTVFVLYVLMVLGIAVAVANFISVQSHALFIPCIQVKYQADPPACLGSGNTCWDCTTPQPPKN